MKYCYFPLIVLLILSLNITAQTEDCPPQYSTSCERSQLEGFWYYKDSPTSVILRQADKAGEKLMEVGIMTDYEIIWKDGCNHDLVVKAVYVDVGTETPDLMKRFLQRPGDRMSYQITAIYQDSMKYLLTFKGKTTCEQTLIRVPKEWHGE